MKGWRRYLHFRFNWYAGYGLHFRGRCGTQMAKGRTPCASPWPRVEGRLTVGLKDTHTRVRTWGWGGGSGLAHASPRSVGRRAVNSTQRSRPEVVVAERRGRVDLRLGGGHAGAGAVLLALDGDRKHAPVALKNGRRWQRWQEIRGKGGICNSWLAETVGNVACRRDRKRSGGRRRVPRGQHTSQKRGRSGGEIMADATAR